MAEKVVLCLCSKRWIGLSEVQNAVISYRVQLKSNVVVFFGRAAQQGLEYACADLVTFKGVAIRLARYLGTLTSWHRRSSSSNYTKCMALLAAEE